MPRSLFAALLLLLVAAPLGAQEEPPLGEGESLVDFAYKACSEAPDSEVCREADRVVRQHTIEALLIVGASGLRGEGNRDLVVAFLEHPEIEIRLAAVAALGSLHPNAADTPLLSRLLNDPVPAVRNAALAALDSSSDPAAIPLVDRARDDQGTSLLPDPPPDPALLGVSLPTGADPLRFVDESEDGAMAFVTDQTQAEVLQYYSQLVGRPVLTRAKLAAALLPHWAGGSMMSFYQQLGERMEDMASLPLDQQMLVQIRMVYLMALLQERTEPPELERWDEAALWGEVRAVVLALDPVFEMPSLLLLAYEDRLLGRTGFALQWLPAMAMPPAAPPPQPTAVPPIGDEPDPAAVEDFLWQAVQLGGRAEDFAAFLAVFPQGLHAAEARAALAEATRATPAPAPAPAPTPGPAPGPTTQPELPTVPPVSVTTTTGFTLSLPGGILAMKPLEITYSGFPGNRNEWITVVPQGTPDTTWYDWSYLRHTEGEMTLPGQRAGAYELRAYFESPREVVARLPFEILSTASGPPALAVEGGTAKAGQPILVRFSNLPGDGSDWIAIVESGQPDSRWDDWAYTRGHTDGDVTLEPQAAGEYELRAYTERPRREVLVRLPLTVLP